MMFRTTMPAFAAVIALAALAACNGTDPAAERKAAAEAKARADAEYKTRLADERLDRQIRCIAAINWQRATIGAGEVGTPQTYIDFYRGQVEGALGNRVIPARPPRPELSASGMDTYLDWDNRYYVETEFTKGDDANRDGTITPWERLSKGLNFAHACVQGAAEMGAGPLGRQAPYERWQPMDRLRKALLRDVRP